MHAEHAERKRVVFREDALAQQRRGDGAIERFRQMHELLVRAGDHAALAGENHRALGFGDHVGGSLDGLRANLERRGGIVAWQVEGRVHVTGERALGNVLRHVDEHRTGAAGGGDVIGLAGDPRQRVGVLHQIIVLHHRDGDAENVGFLERVLAEHPRHRLTGDHEHRHRIHHRGHQAGDGVSRTGAGSHQHGGRPTGGAGVAVGHVHGSLLVADEDELHLGFDRLERVENRDRRSAGISENVFDPEVVEGLDKRLCAVHLIFTHENWGWRPKLATFTSQDQPKIN